MFLALRVRHPAAPPARQRPQLPGIEARPRLPGIGALPSPRQGIPRKKIQGLPPSILLSPQDCLLQSCCHPRIENSTRNSTRGNSEKMGHACFQFRTPRGTPRGATRKKRDMPVSSSELHAGSHQKMVGACFQSEALHKSTSATCAFEHIPARHRRLRYLARHIPAAPARHRSLQPAKPAPRSGFFPGKNSSKLSSISANLPGRAAPARRHGGTQLMSRTNYEAVADFAGHWLHRVAGLAFDRRNRSNQIESHPKKNPGAGLVRAPRPKPRSRPRSKTEAAEPAASLSRSPTDCDTCGNLCRRGVGVFDTPTSGDACEGVCQTHQPPNHRGNFSERPERHEGPVRARCESTTPLRYEFV